MPKRMPSHSVDGKAFIWKMMVAVGLASLEAHALSTRPAGSSSPLDEVIKGKIPLFRLDNHNGGVMPGQSSSYTCFAATRLPNSINWNVTGVQAFDKQHFEIYYSPMATMAAESKNVFTRYSTLTIKKMAANVLEIMVRCVVEQHDSKNHVTATRVTLSTLSKVSKGSGSPLHVTYGQPCQRRTYNCVPEHASCDMSRAGPICLCDNGYRYLDQSRTCVALREHNSPCMLDHPCALVVDKCDGRCHCRASFQQDGAGCRVNVTLNSGCDEYRLCPDGAHCVNNVCACRPGYVPWGYGCLRRFLSGDGMRKVHSVIRFTLTVVFTIAMLFLGVWLYHHAHSPSLMRERSVANWEYMPKMDQT
ncbi:uncharacterized protein [Dermacentor albipictus]|uniref:uncharacterized protein n=1 Tax=Dermacentor albipictus TaxID=60249 RepID=UPI0031FDF658